MNMSAILNDKRPISIPDAFGDKGKSDLITDGGNLNHAGQWKDPWTGPAARCKASSAMAGLRDPTVGQGQLFPHL